MNWPNRVRRALCVGVGFPALGEKARDRRIGAGYHGGHELPFLIQGDPLLDDLRGDPRFEALVQKITGGK